MITYNKRKDANKMTKYRCRSQDPENDKENVWFTTIQENDDPQIAFAHHLSEYASHKTRLLSRIQRPLVEKDAAFDFAILFHTMFSERVLLPQILANETNTHDNPWHNLLAQRVSHLFFYPNDDDLHAHNITIL